MIILGIQETDWLKRGPHTQHHIFERLSKNSAIKITFLDYDMDKLLRSNSLFIKKRKYSQVDRSVKNSNVNIIRTAHIQVPYLRRISSLITNFFEILNFIRKNRPDLIIGFSLSNGIIGLLLARLFRIPYIFYYIDLLHTLVPFPFVTMAVWSLPLCWIFVCGVEGPPFFLKSHLHNPNNPPIAARPIAILLVSLRFLNHSTISISCGFIYHTGPR